MESPEFKSHPYQLATEQLRVRNCISLSLHFHIWKIGKRPIYVTELLCNMNSEPFNAGQASKAGYSGARLWLCAHDGMAQWEGRGGHPGNPALPSDPLSRSQTSEHCPGPRGLRWHLPGMASVTGQSQMNSLRGRRAWHLECGFWDERTVPFWLVRAKKTQAGHTPPLSLTFPAVKWGCREDSRRPVHGTRSVPGKTVC